jgi:regulator of sigma E protease
MNIIIFIIILSVLVFVHEAGHFIAAKLFGVRVDEFGLGYPPRAKKLFKWRGTDFTLNWLPFGGFVKIFGENPTEETKHAKDSFTSKRRDKQALILVSGVFGNFLLAWVLLSIGFMLGMSSPVELGIPTTAAHTTIAETLPGSPASQSGLMPGDEILLITRNGQSISAGSALTPETISTFISSSKDAVNVTIKRGSSIYTKTITPKEGIVPDKPAIGFGLADISIVKLGPVQAVYQGLRATLMLTRDTAKALGSFFLKIFIGKADFSQVSGPVGLVGVTGQALSLGFVYLLSFAALISINLSIVNLLPFPALDGGRLLFVLIEAVIRRPVSPRVANAVNTVGFGLLVFLMIIITVRDVRNIL